MLENGAHETVSGIVGELWIIILRDVEFFNSKEVFWISIIIHGSLN